MFPFSWIKVCCHHLLPSTVITLCFSTLLALQAVWFICKVESSFKEGQLEHLQWSRQWGPHKSVLDSILSDLWRKKGKPIKDHWIRVPSLASHQLGFQSILFLFIVVTGISKKCGSLHLPGLIKIVQTSATLFILEPGNKHILSESLCAAMQPVQSLKVESTRQDSVTVSSL